MITLPEFARFPSQPFGANGSVYQVRGRTTLVAIAEEVPLPFGGGGEATILYAFAEGHRIGYWNQTRDPADLEWVMQTYCAAFDPGAPVTAPEPRIRPTYNREPAAQLRATDPDLHFDVSAAFGERETEPDVIPIDRHR